MNTEKKSPQKNEFVYGFQFSLTDGLIILFCIIITIIFYQIIGNFIFIFPIVLGHFFLFCNVFLVRRKYEHIWGILFLINVSFFMLFSEYNWIKILIIQTPITITLILAEIFSKKYRGIGWQIINPNYVKEILNKNNDKKL